MGISRTGTRVGLATSIVVGAVTQLGAIQACNQVPPETNSVVEAGVKTGWTTIPAGTANLNAVSGVSDDAVWVVGDHGTIGRYNGKTLLFEKSGTEANLRGVWAVGAEDAYAVGDTGTILQRTVAGWQPIAAAVTLQVLTGVWADATRVVAVGSNGTIVLGSPSGTTYNLVPSAYTENLFGITGAVGAPVTIVGALGLVIQLTGTSVSRVTIPAFTKLLSGAATGASTTYFVGQVGTVYRADATGLNPVTGCPSNALRSVATVGDDAWIVGWDGTVCEISGSNATSYPYTDKRWFNGIYAASASSLWVVGASGTLLHGRPVELPGDL
jgi:photosystem II stability/assembly factor-like uncharacterized protein